MHSRGYGGVVKLVITSACHAEGRGFESLRSRHFLLSQQFLFIPFNAIFSSKIAKNVDKTIGKDGVLYFSQDEMFQ